MWKYLVFLLLITVKLSEQKVNVSIFYEALCGDSKTFVTEQLAPNYNAIKDRINLELVPFGKASQQYTGGKWHFQCHFGEVECVLNKYHACALKYASNQSSQVNFASCLLREGQSSRFDITYVKNFVSMCSREAEIQFDKILECYESVESSLLLAAHGNRTKSFGTLISNGFIPTIIYDNVYSRDLQSRSLDQFWTVVWEVINKETTTEGPTTTQKPKPSDDECCCCCDCCC